MPEAIEYQMFFLTWGIILVVMAFIVWIEIK